MKKVLCSAEKSSVIWAEPHSRSSAKQFGRTERSVSHYQTVHKCGHTNHGNHHYYGGGGDGHDGGDGPDHHFRFRLPIYFRWPPEAMMSLTQVCGECLNPYKKLSNSKIRNIF